MSRHLVVPEIGKHYIFTNNKWYPKSDSWVTVYDKDGKEYPDHQWNGDCWYAYIINDDGTCDGWRSDVDVVSWRYQKKGYIYES